MSAGNLFSCPSCGAPLAAPGDNTEVRCSYCGATVIVPDALRPKASSRQSPSTAPYVTPYIPPPQIVIVEPRPMHQPPIAVERRGGLGCFGTLIAVLVIFALLGGMIFAYRPGVLL